MNKCKDCGLWKPETSDFHWMGKCIDLTESDLIIVSEMHPKMPILTHRYFGCVHFEEKERGPFRIQRDIGYSLRVCWRVMYNDEMLWTPDFDIPQAQRWVKLLNELWAQKEKEPLDKNCRCECRTCSFWKDKHPFSDGMWGDCEYAEMRNALPVSCGKAIVGGSMSGIRDCAFHTYENFGCNQWTNL